MLVLFLTTNDEDVRQLLLYEVVPEYGTSAYCGNHSLDAAVRHICVLQISPAGLVVILGSQSLTLVADGFELLNR